MIRYRDASEYLLHKFVTEASQLGWPPGKRPPTVLETEMGNGQPFVFQHLDETGAARYHQRLGCIELVVLND